MDAITKAQTEASESRTASFFRRLFGLPLFAFGLLITILFIFWVFSYLVSRISGGPPVSGFFQIGVLWFFFGGLPLSLGLLLISRIRNPKGLFAGGICLFLVLLVDSEVGPNNWHSIFRRERITRSKASALKSTFVSPHLENPIRPGTNLLWCGTFQLAWNEVCQRTGGDLQLTNQNLRPSSEAAHMIDVLNKRAFTKTNIDEASYVALAGTVADKIDERIVAAVKNKFHNEFKPKLLPEKYTTGRPQDLVAYACLFKRLSFEVPFERLDDSLTFAGTRVRAFGIARTKANHDLMYPQIRILDFQSDTNFIIELKTKSEGDRLILAKVQPVGTLGETASIVTRRIANLPDQSAGTNDILIVPRIGFDLLREYVELENLGLASGTTNVARDLQLRRALQSIKYEMNEKGVELRSEAHMAFACAKEEEPPRTHIMIFDQPFLILLQRTSAPVPYFALWVDNPELMVKW